jgi:hypothetical protein
MNTDDDNETTPSADNNTPDDDKGDALKRRHKQGEPEGSGCGGRALPG